jgi:type III pantothenate kinase
MRLVINLGNTNIVGGIFDRGSLVESFRIHTVVKKTEDEYISIVKAILDERGIEPSRLDGALVSSVVPSLSHAICAMAKRLTGRETLVLGPQTYARLPLRILNPQEIGADLVANALAAKASSDSAAIVADFGTALSFTCTDSRGEIQGVAILPGLGTAVQALSRDTAQLPFVPLDVPSSALGKNTIHAIQSGVVLGYAGLVDSMVARLMKEMGEKAKVFATGGLCEVIAPLVACIDVVDRDLTLKGLCRAFELCEP